MVWIGNNWPFGRENRFGAKKHLKAAIFGCTNMSCLTLEGPGRQTVDTMYGVALKTLGWIHNTRCLEPTLWPQWNSEVFGNQLAVSAETLSYSIDLKIIRQRHTKSRYHMVMQGVFLTAIVILISMPYMECQVPLSYMSIHDSPIYFKWCWSISNSRRFSL